MIWRTSFAEAASVTAEVPLEAANPEVAASVPTSSTARTSVKRFMSVSIVKWGEVRQRLEIRRWGCGLSIRAIFKPPPTGTRAPNERCSLDFRFLSHVRLAGHLHGGRPLSRTRLRYLGRRARMWDSPAGPRGALGGLWRA